VQLLSEAITVSRTSGDRVTLQNCVRYVLLATSAALEFEIFVTVVCFTDFPRQVLNRDQRQTKCNPIFILSKYSMTLANYQMCVQKISE